MPYNGGEVCLLSAEVFDNNVLFDSDLRDSVHFKHVMVVPCKRAPHIFEPVKRSSMTSK